MCGRFTLATPGEVIAELFSLPAVPDLSPRYNIAPTQDVAIVRNRASGEREWAAVHWGLIPSWAKDPGIGARMINARAETIAEKPAFRSAFRARRCLIPADGFFEWRKLEGRKQPYYITWRGGKPFAFAGLWETWRGGDAPAKESCTILTTSPNEVLVSLHDRMPVILSPRDHAAWLDGATEREALLALLAPCPSEEVEAYPVSLRVNSPRNDDPGCIARL